MQVKTVRILFLVFLTTLSQCFHSEAFAEKTDWEYYENYGDRSVTWDPLVEEGFEAFEGENYQAGIHFLKRAIGIGCQDGLVYYKLSKNLEESGDLPRALEMLKKAEPGLRNRYQKHSVTKELSDHMGGLYYQMNRFEEALKYYLTGIQENGENFLRVYLAGQIYRMKGETEKGVAYFESALKYEPPPGSPPHMKLLAMIELIQLYAQAKQDDKVLLLSEEILKQDPTNRTALTYRDNILHKRRQGEQRQKWKEILKKYQ